MGAFSNLEIGEFSGFTNKNQFFRNIVEAIFRPSDYLEEMIKDEDEFFLTKGYLSNVRICKERLEAFGATIKKAELEYYARLKNLADDGLISSNVLTFEESLAFIKECIEKYDSDFQLDDDRNISYFKRDLASANFLICETLDLSLYCIFYTLSSDTKVFYNLTYILDSWINKSDLDTLEFRKIIILTEGKTDSEFIRKSLIKQYPYLADIYHFMDFKKFRVDGGASFLSHNVKAFIGSGIKNKIIALFDNDTAGLKEFSNLLKIDIPSNIKVVKYPNIALAEDYPTLGPTGLKNMNINGLACSIELYLGRDILIKDDALIPIRWGGCDGILKMDQGVIQDKKLIQDRFREKIKINVQSNSDESWKEMLVLLDLIKNIWR